MDYFVYLTLFGAVALSIGWVKQIAQRFSISYSIIYLGVGIAVYLLIDDLPWTSPFRDQAMTSHITELMVIVALMGIGLKINRKLSFSGWRAPFMLATVAMLLTIGIISGLAYAWLGFGIASAVLLGAVLAPTDPVLASDVQVEEPNSEKDHIVRFSLTGEAGINDGLAFPFTWLAITLATLSPANEGWLAEWFAYDVCYRIIVGVIIGWVGGRIVTYLFFKLPDELNITDIQRGLVSLSATLFVYGVSEICHGYGFIAVFVTAVIIRNYCMEHDYHSVLHAFIDQIEHILLAVLLVIFGGALTDGLLNALTLTHFIFALVFVLAVRPLAAWISLTGCNIAHKHRAVISFFGIRGIGSFFYLSFAMKEAEFAGAEELWSITACIVVISIIVHGLSAATIMKRLKI